MPPSSSRKRLPGALLSREDLSAPTSDLEHKPFFSSRLAVYHIDQTERNSSRDPAGFRLASPFHTSSLYLEQVLRCVTESTARTSPELGGNKVWNAQLARQACIRPSSR